ncbi:MAG TPA: ABC transporter substrate-binding protein, partial [Actinopolymorphaceae bacterium]
MAGVAALAGCSSGGANEDPSGEGPPKGKADPSKKGSVTEPIAPPGKYSESPLLKARVDAGDLPPVEKRLPEVPYVPPHRWLEPGRYGGKLQMIMNESDSAAIKEYCY